MVLLTGTGEALRQDLDEQTIRPRSVRARAASSPSAPLPRRARAYRVPRLVALSDDALGVSSHLQRVASGDPILLHDRAALGALQLVGSVRLQRV